MASFSSLYARAGQKPRKSILSGLCLLCLNYLGASCVDFVRGIKKTHIREPHMAKKRTAQEFTGFLIAAAVLLKETDDSWAANDAKLWEYANELADEFDRREELRYAAAVQHEKDAPKKPKVKLSDIQRKKQAQGR